MPHSTANCSVLCITLNFVYLPNLSFFALVPPIIPDIWLPSIVAMANSYPTCARRTQQPDTPTDAGGLEVTPDISVGKMMTFNLNMGVVLPRKRKRRSKEEQEQTNEIRSRGGACSECRLKKRQVCHVHAKIYSSLDA